MLLFDFSQNDKHLHTTNLSCGSFKYQTTCTAEPIIFTWFSLLQAHLTYTILT